jgi:hypothetical protein
MMLAMLCLAGPWAWASATGSSLDKILSPYALAIMTTLCGGFGWLIGSYWAKRRS